MENRRLTLYFPPDLTCRAFTYDLVKIYDWRINIIRAAITEGKEGRLLIDVEADNQNLKEGLAFLIDEGIEVKNLEKQVFIEFDDCLACGACTAVCLPGALEMDKENWELTYNQQKCIVCGLCEPACPINIITLGF